MKRVGENGSKLVHFKEILCRFDRKYWDQFKENFNINTGALIEHCIFANTVSESISKFLLVKKK